MLIQTFKRNLNYKILRVIELLIKLHNFKLYINLCIVFISLSVSVLMVEILVIYVIQYSLLINVFVISIFIAEINYIMIYFYRIYKS